MKHFLFILALCFMLGCNSKGEQEVIVNTDLDKDSEIITAKDIENLNYIDYVLSPDAKEATINWQRYQELMVQIDFLKRADFSFFSGKNELLLNVLKDLRNDIPQNVSSPAIIERLIALETKILKFHSTLKLSNKRKLEILANIKEVLVATSNLHLQMNKKFELESQVIEDPSINQLPTD